MKSQIATPDTTTFPGSDYYEIAVVQYQQSLHKSLPPTTLRGYEQLPSGSTGCATPSMAPSYLGPVIVAQKNRPVRVKFTNCLPTGTAGNLFIPTDTTYMGSGAGQNGTTYSENRATLHLHGGASPWISDGTPHQWTVPVGDSAALQVGESVAYVPDMYFDTNGKVLPQIPQCSATQTTNCYPNALPTGYVGNNPGQGSMTFYWTNQQGGRLMFYHDHSYGVTRLNVYAGEAAGYLLTDPVQENELAAATVPGTFGTVPDTTHLIPMVIQDKTFVPSQAQLAAQDPTWINNFGATGLISSPTASANGGNGDIWFPHVYMTNQNPSDPLMANGLGRWDYGPWFFPSQTNLTAAPAGSNGITIPCTSALYPGQTLDCPITPNPSGTPEGFMDTPLVNGKAYPSLSVAPATYRFQILNASNDRSLNLSWFIADDTGKDVAMVPAALPNGSSTLQLCTSINPVAVPQLVLGLTNALLGADGNPVNGTGLPAGCWPNYGPQSGIPAAQTMWAADGRNGGVPDPTKAGPPWIQIASEGGLLPAPVIIPATPINYEQNTRSITITSVGVHGLWLGPAERADVIVDFSQLSGKTLILYNDAPTPAPAYDSRLDYFTGNGDQTPIGGAPSTQPGFGPNTRTIMQVVVDAAISAPNTTPFSLSALKNAFTTTAAGPGLFASTQPTTIVPEAAYNSAYNQSFKNTYGGIASTNLTFTPIGSNSPLTFDRFNEISAAGNNCANSPNATTGAQCGLLDNKTIQELFTLDYGRMNATLGVEVPFTNFLTQTTIPYGYIDPPTEIVRQGDTQLWRITHNGVDTHFIHFHLWNVQVVNRVGWDGSLRQPDSNELGWKDTVRMNPLEDVLVALQPITPTLPFPLPDSIRAMDVTGLGPFTANDPTNAALTVTNSQLNFGWEYVWHCHILGHEENDMMRPIIFEVAPPAPSNLVASTDSNTGNVVLTWTDNSSNETSFTVQRDTSTAFAAPTTFQVNPVSTTGYGNMVSYTDTTVPSGTSYYRVVASDNYLVGNATQSSPYPAPFQAVPMVSTPSNVASTSVVAPALLSFTGAPVNATYQSSFTVAATTNVNVTPTIVGVGNCSVGLVTGTKPATATVTMTAGYGTCVLTATVGTSTLSQTTTAVPVPPIVSFSGAPVTAVKGNTFTVTATTNANIAPSIAGTANICSVGAVTGTSPATALVTMLANSGTCALTATWGVSPNATTPNYAAASAKQTTIAAELVPLVTLSGYPGSAVYDSSFTVRATTNATGVATPTITGNAACSVGPVTGTTNATAIVTMNSGTGECVVTANWLATATYQAAAKSVNVLATQRGSRVSVTARTPNPTNLGVPVLISVNVVGNGNGLPFTPAAPTGSVTILANTGESCTTANLSATSGATNATGSCSLTFYTPGQRQLSVYYSSDAKYGSSVSSSSLTVNDFAIGAVRTVSGTATATTSASYTFTANPIYGTGTPTVTCNGVPSGATCTPSIVTTGNTKNITVSIGEGSAIKKAYTGITFTVTYGSVSHTSAGVNLTLK